jgi:hypothetical protein
VARKLACLVMLASLGATGVAWARSGGHLVGDVTGKTSQRGGLIDPAFDHDSGRLFNVSGDFRCTGSKTKTGLYEFSTNGIATKKQPAFRFGHTFTLKVAQRWDKTGQSGFKPIHYEKGHVFVTVTGKITEVSPPHGSRSGKAKGGGTVTFRAAGCSTGKLKWSGTGPYLVD